MTWFRCLFRAWVRKLFLGIGYPMLSMGPDYVTMISDCQCQNKLYAPLYSPTREHSELDMISTKLLISFGAACRTLITTRFNSEPIIICSECLYGLLHPYRNSKDEEQLIYIEQPTHNRDGFTIAF